MIIKKDQIILYVIICVAIIIRTISPFDIPYTHDEFSALFRTQFSSFSDLINFGVKPDGHPAGIQVFLFYWTKLFGNSEIVVKLPFIILGVLSVWLMYLIGKGWYNRTVGLISASFLSTLEYFVTYSQIARPYISGLFFSLLMVFFWTRIILIPQKKVFLNALAYVVASILCAYNHYFSLLFAVIVGITGLFLVDKRFLRTYIILGILIFAAFIPHLNIFYEQLKIGGIEGWLGKPRLDFLIEYLEFAFNSSYLILALVCFLIGYGFYKNEKALTFNRVYLISFCWFILPFLIGFLYSTFVNAVLQFSMLIFSFPFFILLLFGHLPELPTIKKWILVSIILIVSTASLVLERKHYTYFYNSAYEKILLHHDSLKKGGSNYVSIIDSHKEISQYYIKKLSLDTTFIWADSFASLVDFRDFVKKQKANNLYFGCISWSNPALIPIIQEYFPFIEWQKDYYTGTAYYFSKTRTPHSQPLIFDSCMDFESEDSHWSISRRASIIDSIGFQSKSSYEFKQDDEYGPLFSINLKDIIQNRNNFIDITFWAKFEKYPQDALVYSALESKGRSVDWRSTSINSFFPKDSSINEWVKVNHTIKLSDIYIKYPRTVLKVGFLNRNKQTFLIDHVCVRVRKGNTVIYGL